MRCDLGCGYRTSGDLFFSGQIMNQNKIERHLEALQQFHVFTLAQSTAWPPRLLAHVFEYRNALEQRQSDDFEELKVYVLDALHTYILMRTTDAIHMNGPVLGTEADNAVWNLLRGLRQ
jgi:hypothetical protein